MRRRYAGRCNQPRERRSLAKVLADVEVQDKFGTFGFGAFSTPAADIPRHDRADSKRYAEIVKRAKIAVE